MYDVLDGAAGAENLGVVVPDQIPMVEYLVLGDEPHLEANECTACGARFFDRRNACASCSGREFKKATIATEGEVRAFTIVTPFIPGMSVPYVPVVVDCGGTSVRGNLVNVEPDARARRARHEGQAHHVLHRRRLHRHRGHQLRLRAGELRGNVMANDDIWILGINMTKFGKHPDKDVVDLASEAALAALDDAGVTMKDIGVLAAGNLMGAAAGIGQQLQKQIGQTGIPVFNVANACATGATALRTVIMAIKAGETDMGLAVGVEKLSGAGMLGGGANTGGGNDEWTRAGRYGTVSGFEGRIGTDMMPGVFAQVGMEYGHKYGGTSFELFARISEKNHKNSTLNPLAAIQKDMSFEQIMNEPMIAFPNTRAMCSANSDGAAAAVVVSGEKLRKLSLEQQKRAVKVSASVLTSDPYQEACQILPDVNTLTRIAATQAYEQAGVGPEDLNLVELHDCFATAELVHYDNLMLCAEGGAVDFFESGAAHRTGSTPVNVSGGLESKGHPIAATGIANVWEICHHLRGEAGDRQIEGAKVGLAHVIGLGSACGVHILEKSGL